MTDDHDYGGNWTDQKLDILQKYLSFFTTALRNQNFQLLYIDGFAGSGGRVIERILARESPLFGTTNQSEKVNAPGSARIALETDPPFHRILLNERHGKRFAALKKLCAEHPNIQIDLLKGDANDAIVDLCQSTVWRGPRVPDRGVRAVLFLDPYGMNLKFSTLEVIAATQAIDVWYLFPLSGVYRQASIDGRKLTSKKRESITRILGTDEWETEFYPPREDLDLFGSLPESVRSANVQAIENYVKKRLMTIFPKVTDPRRLSMDNGAPLFSLFFAMSNPDPRAIGLALKAANHILKTGISSHVRPRN
ncbi:three-Cys-motif partner protein TcmP [Methylobacterium sp. J-068]|uniref:three-Cys-motif partner protein TcmP n=1 Tax=Methylobacterium sp. J-068 TaxID=2836649 RepID=UPI001FB8ACD0|nr:three-Cys-motif partner protein TcmP [Methylobacterium sp. J-068]MCJ2035705.1 three-Cys-motif partner protein TcmP [Methylobacterium sp. J-068]